MVQKARDNLEFASFISTVTEQDQFKKLVDAVEKNTIAWGYTVGLLGEKKPDADSGLSDKEKQWKKYFSDHAFSNPEEQRNLCDAFSIIEGMDLNKFIKVIRATKSSFAPCISIVPTGNTNSHDYSLGKPIFNFSRGTTFHKLSGSSGNQMTSRVQEYRLSTREEIVQIIQALMYRIGVAAETLVYTLIKEGE
jgi:hypothetical protein